MRREAVAALLLAIAFLSASPLAAQRGVGAPGRRLDSLAAAAVRATDRLQAYDDSVRREAQRLDSAIVGPLRLFAERSLSGIAGDAARSVVDTLAPRFGSTLERIAGVLFVVRRYVRPPAIRDTQVLITVLDASGVEIANRRVAITDSTVTAGLRELVPYVLIKLSAPDLLAWTGNMVPHDGRISPEEWSLYRLHLVSSPAVVGRRCYQGDLRACGIALQLVTTGDPVTEWYDAADRRRIVQDQLELWQIQDARAARGCIGGSDFACISLMRRSSVRQLPPPTPQLLKWSLARYAVSTGGPQALPRMLESQAGPAERLAAAGDAPIDSVVSRWRRHVHATRAPSGDLSANVVWVTLVWSLGLGMLSLRSSRWR